MEQGELGGVERLIEAIEEKWVEKQEGGLCWRWKGPFDEKYRKPFFLKDENHKKIKTWAHRFFFREYVSGIPRKGMVWRLCFNDRCVNPKHMKIVMPGETQPSKIVCRDLYHGKPNSQIRSQ